MNANHNCPYCDAPQEHCNDEPFDQDAMWEEECSSCGKFYMLQGWYVEEYDASVADCLNGGVHDLRPVRCFPPGLGFGQYQCRACNTRITDEKERQKLLGQQAKGEA